VNFPSYSPTPISQPSFDRFAAAAALGVSNHFIDLTTTSDHHLSSSDYYVSTENVCRPPARYDFPRTVAIGSVRRDGADSTACKSELQVQYQTFKNTLQQLAQKIGDVEQEAEEHKYVEAFFDTSARLAF
jgi:hypothetical protein